MAEKSADDRRKTGRPRADRMLADLSWRWIVGKTLLLLPWLIRS
jgi:hypothetical protein